MTLGLCLFGCGTNHEYLEPDYPQDTPYNPNDNQADAYQEEETTEQKVRKNVSASVYYSNYFWHISITSGLESVLTGKTFKYGVECGYGNYDIHVYADPNDTYASMYGINLYSDDSGLHISMELSVFDGMGNYSVEAFYVRTYLSVLQKQSAGETLTADERQLLSYYGRVLPEKEAIAKRDFIGRIFVEVGGTRYYIQTF